MNRRSSFFGAIAAFALAGALSVGQAGAVVSSATGAAAKSDTPSGAAATASRTVSRYQINADGSRTVTDNRSVSVTASQATELAGGQRISVSWTGAHPSQNDTYGDVFSDPNPARTTEYPMVLLECRGVDSASAPSAQQMTPETCFTSNYIERSPGAGASPLWEVDAAADSEQSAAQVPATDDHDTADACFPAAAGNNGPAAAYDYLPFTGASGSYYASCSNYLDSSNQVQSTYAPEVNSGDSANDAFVPSDSTGAGSTIFNIRTEQENANLGCSQTVSCSLVAVPILGVSCDLSNANASQAVSRFDYQNLGQLCTSTGDWPGNIAAGQNRGGQSSSNDADPAVSGLYWSLPSNWANRVSIPLGFATATNFCSTTDTRTPEQFYGSEILGDATQQWAPAFCSDPNRFNYQHVRITEFQARNQVNTGASNAAFTTEPPDTPWSKPVVESPVAVTGFAVGYTVRRSVNVQTATGPVKVYRDEYDQMRLTPRLLAKLITESYTGSFTDDPDLQGNPYALFADPEFKALNPGIELPGGVVESSASLLQLSTISDVIYSLTSYINADPEARAWLNGAPDPWGMHVNPAYKGISLPVSRWQLLDTSLDAHAGDAYSTSTGPACPQLTQTPYLGLVAAPVSSLATITTAVLQAYPNVQTACHVALTPGDYTHPTRIPQPPFNDASVIGIVPLGDVARFQLHAASLQTNVSPFASAKFTNAAGRTFVAPTDATLANAVKGALQPDAAANTWTLNYSAMRTDPSLANSYPLTMPVFAAIPTSGLTAKQAADYSQFLRFAASDGQVKGLAPGQLAPGYSPMTSANGMGFLVNYANLAAAAVAAQTGAVPQISGGGSPSALAATGTTSAAKSKTSSKPKASATAKSPGATTSPASSAPAAVAGATVAGSEPSAVASTGTTTIAPAGAGEDTASSATPAKSSNLAASTLRTPGVGATSAGALLPALLGVAVLAGLVAALSGGLPSRTAFRRRRSA